MTPEYQAQLLSLISTSDLEAELLGRFDHIILSGLKDRPTEGDPGNQITSWRYKGNPLVCQGLACGIIDECNAHRGRQEEPIDASEL